ncbi:MAG: hypothetical protein J2P16_11045 [Mycobacterium sp.]|nr:hypothetical protein [Mycobacterium sp.]
MTATLHDLLCRARLLITDLPADGDGAELAIATLGPMGRAMRVLAGDGLDKHSGIGPRTMAVAELARRCERTATGWPTPTARLLDMAGVAADAASRLSVDLGRGDRWPVAVEFAEVARQCELAARRHPPFRPLSPLCSVHRLTGLIERLAAIDPSDPQRRAGLDRPIPSPCLPCGPVGPGLAVDAAAGLAAEIDTATAGPGLRVREARAVAVVCTVVARYLTQVYVRPPLTHHTDPLAAVRDWRAVHRTLIPFRDHVRDSPHDSSPLIDRLALLRRCLNDSDLGQNTVDLGRSATHARMIANQLPTTAAALATGLARTADRSLIIAPARLLPAEQARTDPTRTAAVIRNQLVPVNRFDIDPVTTALRRVETSSVCLAAQLAHTAGYVGVQPQPHLAAALISRAGHTRDLHI